MDLIDLESPGVQVHEIQLPNLLIKASPTAIPAILCDSGEFSSWFGGKASWVRVHSWGHVIRLWSDHMDWALIGSESAAIDRVRAAMANEAASRRSDLAAIAAALAKVRAAARANRADSAGGSSSPSDDAQKHFSRKVEEATSALGRAESELASRDSAYSSALSALSEARSAESTYEQESKLAAFVQKAQQAIKRNAVAQESNRHATQRKIAKQYALDEAREHYDKAKSDFDRIAHSPILKRKIEQHEAAAHRCADLEKKIKALTVIAEYENQGTSFWESLVEHAPIKYSDYTYEQIEQAKKDRISAQTELLSQKTLRDQAFAQEEKINKQIAPLRVRKESTLSVLKRAQLEADDADRAADASDALAKKLSSEADGAQAESQTLLEKVDELKTAIAAATTKAQQALNLARAARVKRDEAAKALENAKQGGGKVAINASFSTAVVGMGQAEGVTTASRQPDMKRASKRPSPINSSDTSSSASALHKATIYESLRAYFDHGGGPCYVVSAANIDAVDALDDVTLIVQAGTGASIGGKCSLETGIFGISDGDSSAGDFGAGYSPSLKRHKAEVATPPSAIMAGVYCRVDREFGVWHSPENIALNDNLDFDSSLSGGGGNAFVKTKRKGEENDDRKPEHIEVQGGQTSGGGSIGERRLLNAMERDIKRALRSVLFEPNAPVTWEMVRSAIGNYLYNIWLRGGLDGATPSEGYDVKIGLGATMTEEDLAEGKMLAQVRVWLAGSDEPSFVLVSAQREDRVGRRR